MTYYEKLVAAVDKAARKNPNRTMAMSTKDFRILAKGKDSGVVARKIGKLPEEGVAVVFAGSKPNETWIL